LPTRRIERLRGQHFRNLVTGGFWWDVYKGDFGRFRVGGQGSYTERRVFAGVGGGPNTNEGIFMGSRRYYPFAP